MKLTIFPGTPLRGTVHVPGDKSLSHRAALLAALAPGESRIDNFLQSGVTRVMLEALKALGVGWSIEGNTLTVAGRGAGGLLAPDAPLYCGNSATTMRMLAGAVAAAGIPCSLDGSPGLRRRPMERIVEPLQMMGVPVTSADGGTAPLVFDGRAPGAKLRSANITLSVASAQVKSCLLLAGLAADGPSRLFEPGPSRDHTERMLASQGVDVLRKEIGQGGCEGVETTLVPLQKPLLPLRMTLPGDFSAAAFLITAAAITPGSDVLLPGVGLNPTRTGLLDALRAMGAEIDVTDPGEQGGEPVGDLHVRAARMNGGIVQGDAVVRMIDEFPVFGAAAALAAGRTVVRDAVELRYKETDRIATLCGALSDLGVPAEEAPDGFTVTGGDVPGGETHGRGDHRLAMAMAVMGLAAKNPVVVHGAEIMHESYPGFVDALHRLGAQVTMETRP